MQLLQTRVDDLHSLAGALIEVETLTSKQVCVWLCLWLWLCVCVRVCKRMCVGLRV